MWRRKQLQTQLASWAELRHDNLLYAKQSYSRGKECDYPSVYLEPYPKIYAGLQLLCEETARRIEAAGFANANHGVGFPVGGPVGFLRETTKTLERLQRLADKELAAEPFDAADRTWLKHALSEQLCDSGDNTYDGWYWKLFYHPTEDKMLSCAAVAADVHSAPVLLDEGPLPGTAAVLEVATGSCDLLVIAINNEDDRGLYVGPVYSFYEFPQAAGNRLTDEQWHEILSSGTVPSRPHSDRMLSSTGPMRCLFLGHRWHLH